MSTLAIKNMSMAYEALTHAQGTEDLCSRLYLLIDKEIFDLEKERERQDTKSNPASIDPNDDISS